MTSRTSAVIVVLLLMIGVLLWLLSTKSAEAPTVPLATVETSTAVPVETPNTSPKPPLSAKVLVVFPKPNASVPKKFTVTGKAPGNWFFEASAPIQIRDSENSKIFQGTIKTEEDWMTTKLVPFSGEITVSGYTGPATLVLLRDNPSGLPENDDSIEVPIVIQ